MKVIFQNSTLSFRTMREPDFEGEVVRTSTTGTGGKEWILAIPGVSAGEKIFFQLRGDLAMSGLVGRAYIKDRSGSGTVITNVVEFPNGVGDAFSDDYSGTLTVTADAASNAYFQYYSDVNPNPERQLFVRAWIIS